jgi:hypothetical protein
MALVAAAIGWLLLYRAQPRVAKSLVIYAVLLTAFHLPLTMNTRLRVPLFDPLVATLVGCSIYYGWSVFRGLFKSKYTDNWSSAQRGSLVSGHGIACHVLIRHS